MPMPSSAPISATTATTGRTRCCTPRTLPLGEPEATSGCWNSLRRRMIRQPVLADVVDVSWIPLQQSGPIYQRIFERAKSASEIRRSGGKVCQDSPQFVAGAMGPVSGRAKQYAAAADAIAALPKERARRMPGRWSRLNFRSRPNWAHSTRSSPPTTPSPKSARLGDSANCRAPVVRRRRQAVCAQDS